MERASGRDTLVARCVDAKALGRIGRGEHSDKSARDDHGTKDDCKDRNRILDSIGNEMSPTNMPLVSFPIVGLDGNVAQAD